MTERDKLDEMEEYYIEKEALYLLNGEELINVTIEAPAVDVVKVVRCKDCKHQPNLKTSTKGMVWCRKFRSEVQPMDYCSYGEKENSNE